MRLPVVRKYGGEPDVKYTVTLYTCVSVLAIFMFAFMAAVTHDIYMDHAEIRIYCEALRACGDARVDQKLVRP